MAYQKQTFKDGETLLNAELMNNIQNGIIENGIDPDLNVVVFGDSIFDNKAARKMLQDFGCNLRNHAVSGSTITTHLINSLSPLSVSKQNNTIFKQWDEFCSWADGGIDTIETRNAEYRYRNYNFKTPDVIILDGGANDWQKGIPLWEVGDSSSYAGTSYISPLEEEKNGPGTFLGDNINTKLPRYNPENTTGEIPTFAKQLERLMFEMSKKFPKSQRFFVKAHRMYQVKFNLSWTDFPFIGRYYWPEIENSSYVKDLKYKYTQNDLYGNYLDSICHKYGFRIIDIYNDSSLNGVHTPSEVYFVRSPDTTPVYYITSDSDGQKKVNNSKINDSIVPNWEKHFEDNSGEYLSTTDPDGNQIYVNQNKVQVSDIELFDWKGLHPTEMGYEFGYKPLLSKELTHCRKKLESNNNSNNEYIE